MPNNKAKDLVEKLVAEWPPERVLALATSTDPKEIEAGASALRNSLNLCTQLLTQKRPAPKNPATAKVRRDISEMRDTVRKMLRDRERPASGRH